MADEELPTLTIPEPAKDVGFSMPIQMVFLFGILMMLITGLFRAILITSDDPSEGLADTSVWFGWIGGSILALAIVAAGFTAKDTSTGGRIALIAVGLYFFFQVSNSAANFLSLFGSFF